MYIDNIPVCDVEGDDKRYFVRPFFRQAIEMYALDSTKDIASNCIFISVDHIVPTLKFFLEALEKIGASRIGAVIPKSSINDAQIKGYIESRYDHAFKYTVEPKFLAYKGYFEQGDIKGLLRDHPSFAVDLVKYVYENFSDSQIE